MASSVGGGLLAGLGRTSGARAFPYANSRRMQLADIDRDSCVSSSLIRLSICLMETDPIIQAKLAMNLDGATGIALPDIFDGGSLVVGQ